MHGGNLKLKCRCPIKKFHNYTTPTLMHIAYWSTEPRKSIPLKSLRMNNDTAIANYDVRIAFVYFKLRLLHQYWHRTGRLNINQMADVLWTRQLGTIDNNKAVPSWVRGFGVEAIQLHTALLSWMWYRLYSFVQLFWAGCGIGYTASYSCSELDVV